ncbi:MAG: hypothetical protein K2X09_04245 [Rickettsiales bacterium]|nr:hypothetical protein [Rickettsiales bacterium]
MQQAVIKQCQANYKRLLDLLPNVQTMAQGSAVKMKADQFQDLCIDIIQQKESVTQISMAHYYEQNGDLVPDPDMEIVLMHVTRMALPVHFQNALAYRVCVEGTRVINGREFVDQSSFLSMWLRNIKAQGHQLINATETE